MNLPIQQFDVLVIDFPFLDMDQVRLRPALVISSTDFIAKTGVASVAMITREAAPGWPGDVVLDDPIAAGLHKPSKLRMKFHSVAVGNAVAVGHLSTQDRLAVIEAFRDHLAL